MYKSWHGLVVHRLLEITNRMRRVVYAESRKLKLRVNGFRYYIEPAGLKDVPAPVIAPQLSLPHQPAIRSLEVGV